MLKRSNHTPARLTYPVLDVAPEALKAMTGITHLPDTSEGERWNAMRVILVIHGASQAFPVVSEPVPSGHTIDLTRVKREVAV